MADEQAFGQLVDPYSRELQVHCYRLLGSVSDAEDALQETLLAAWQGLASFEGRSSIRTWLYRVATRRCLNALRSRSRRPQPTSPMANFDLPEPSGVGEVVWLEPYPDVLLERVADSQGSPEARYETREAISLAFVTALQLLPPRQRAILILRDVLGYHAAEVANMLDATEESVTSALKRARATLHRRQPAPGTYEPAPPPNSAVERELVERLTRAFEAGDVEAIVGLLTDDVRFTMPPSQLEYVGRTAAGRFLAMVASKFWLGNTPRVIATRANRQPALTIYVWDSRSGSYAPATLLVLTLAGHRVSAMASFDPSVLPPFGLPETLG
jgi:RNA polymerase sigma-70 factor (ECF subfamily)